MPAIRRAAITGGPGAGKSTLLEELARRGIGTVPEVARIVLKAPGGMELRDCNPLGFADVMLEAQLERWQNASRTEPVIFDRGFCDIAGFLQAEDLPVSREIDHACRTLRFDGPVFRAKAWKAIYSPDDERIQTWEEAVASDEAVSAAWRAHGYDLIELSATGLAQRADFVITHL